MTDISILMEGVGPAALLILFAVSMQILMNFVRMHEAFGCVSYKNVSNVAELHGGYLSRKEWLEFLLLGL